MDKTLEQQAQDWVTTRNDYLVWHKEQADAGWDYSPEPKMTAVELLPLELQPYVRGLLQTESKLPPI